VSYEKARARAQQVVGEVMEPPRVTIGDGFLVVTCPGVVSVMTLRQAKEHRAALDELILHLELQERERERQHEIMGMQQESSPLDTVKDLDR